MESYTGRYKRGEVLHRIVRREVHVGLILIVGRNGELVARPQRIARESTSIFQMWSGVLEADSSPPVTTTAQNFTQVAIQTPIGR